MTFAEFQAGARNLPEDQRFALVTDLVGSSPAVLSDFDDGSDEASRRLSEMRSDFGSRRTWEQVKIEMGR